MPRPPAGDFENFSIIIKIDYLANRYFAKSQNNDDPAYQAFLSFPTNLLFLQKLILLLKLAYLMHSTRSKQKSLEKNNERG